MPVEDKGTLYKEGVMDTYLMLGRYSADAIRDISSDRTEKSIHLISQLGGKVLSMYALLGGYDAVMIVSFPTQQDAMRASLGLTMLTGIAFSTFPAVSVDDFDKMMQS